MSDQYSNTGRLPKAGSKSVWFLHGSEYLCKVQQVLLANGYISASGQSVGSESWDVLGWHFLTLILRYAHVSGSQKDTRSAE